MSTHQLAGSDKIRRIRRALLRRSGPHCQICQRAGMRMGAVINMSLPREHPLSATIDHIVERSAGGSDELENLQLTHRVCNERKSGHVRQGWEELGS